MSKNCLKLCYTQFHSISWFQHAVFATGFLHWTETETETKTKTSSKNEFCHWKLIKAKLFKENLLHTEMKVVAPSSYTHTQKNASPKELVVPRVLAVLSS